MRMIYLWYALKSIITKTPQNCFFLDSLIYVLVRTGVGLLLIFVGIAMFVIRRKQKQVHAMTDTKDNSSTDFSKNFLTIFKKNAKNLFM